MTASREKQIASLVGNVACVAAGLLVSHLTKGSWWYPVAVLLACVANVAGYIEGQASVRRYLDGER